MLSSTTAAHTKKKFPLLLKFPICSSCKGVPLKIYVRQQLASPVFPVASATAAVKNITVKSAPIVCRLQLKIPTFATLALTSLRMGKTEWTFTQVASRAQRRMHDDEFLIKIIKMLLLFIHVCAAGDVFASASETIEFFLQLESEKAFLKLWFFSWVGSLCLF